jgi:hypothetical protein
LQASIKAADDKEEFKESIGFCARVYAGSTRRLVRFEAPKVVTYYDGKSGEERVVRRKHIGGIHEGIVSFYKGERSHERKVLALNSRTGDEYFYDGDNGAERMTRIKKVNGDESFYEGEGGSEQLTRIRSADGTEKFYKGEKDSERLTRIKHKNGDEEFYAGNCGAEHLISINRVNGDVESYRGINGALCRIQRANGDDEFYIGEKGNEQKNVVEVEAAHVYFRGEKGKERKIHARFKDGNEEWYEGDQGVERLVKRKLKNGDEHNFKPKLGKNMLFSVLVSKTQALHLYEGDWVKEIQYPDGTYEFFTYMGMMKMADGTLKTQTRMTRRSKVILEPVLETEYFSAKGIAYKKRKRVPITDNSEYGLYCSLRRRRIARAFLGGHTGP